MRQETQEAVERLLRRFVDEHRAKLAPRSLEDIRLSYPFHRIIFPDAAIAAARAERSIVTVMGTNLYPALAREVARDKFADVHLEYVVEGNINTAAVNMIEEIVRELRTPLRSRASDRRPDHEVEMGEILGSRGGGPVMASVTADLYIGDFTGGPAFIELKTPRPNLDIAAESKRKLLYELAICERAGILGAEAFLGLTYNPFITRERYDHSFTRQIMDMERQVLMGSELWDFIGGPGAYEELLSIIDRIQPTLG